MRKALIAVLLSTFAGPGFGQFYNKQVKKGFILLGVTLVVFTAFMIWICFTILPYLPTDPKLITMPMVRYIQKDIPKTYPLPWNSFRAAIGLLWAYGMVDAFLTAMPKQAETENS